MKTYLVTGGAGFIGTNFIRFLQGKYKDKIKIINIDKITYAGNKDNLKDIKNKKNYIFKQLDICNKKSIKKIFQQYDIDYVVNFAAESHVDNSIKNPNVFVKTNVIGTQVLLDIAKKSWEVKDGFKPGKKFIQISTDEVYGSLGESGYFNEETPLDPHSPYSASKAAADLIVKSYFDTFKFPINITRCSNNYGPFQYPEKLIPLIITRALKGDKLPVYGDGSNIRDWLYVKDHCRAINKVITKGEMGEVYNIGGNNEKRNIDIVKLIIEILADNIDKDDKRRHHISEDLIEYVEDRKGHDKRYAIDSEKIKGTIGWEPKITFHDGIMKTINWYLNNEKWLNNIKGKK